MKETILITLLLFISLLYNSYSNEAVSPQNSNSKTSIDQLKHLAESGDATAQFQIANILWKGEGVQENDLEAKKWFEKSALNGNPEAQEIIGGIYFQRYPFEGVDEYDVKKAIYWYNKAAEKNNVDAMTELATIYWFGKGVPINIDLSQGYVQKVFDTMSSTNIASLSARFIQLCSSETNVTSNETYRFLEKFWVPAANSGEVASANRLGDAYSYGDIGAPESLRMKYKSFSDYLKAKKEFADFKEAAKWYRISADNGDMNGQRLLGQLYLDGNGLPKNDEEAVRWLQKAANQGDPDAMFSLGMAYSNPDSMVYSSVQAYKWFNLASIGDGSSGLSEKLAQAARETCSKGMKPEEIREAQRLSLEFKPQKTITK